MPQIGRIVPPYPDRHRAVRLVHTVILGRNRVGDGQLSCRNGDRLVPSLVRGCHEITGRGVLLLDPEIDREGICRLIPHPPYPEFSSLTLGYGALHGLYAHGRGAAPVIVQYGNVRLAGGAVDGVGARRTDKDPHLAIRLIDNVILNGRSVRGG